MIIATLLALQAFPQTISPSKTWGIVHAMSGENDINQLANLKTEKIVCTLKGFSGFEGENHGGMNAAYSKDESFVVAMQAGKWEPRALAVIATKSGTQLDLLKKVQADATLAFTKKNNKSFVFDVLGSKLSATTLSVSVIGSIPKDENSASLYGSLTYAVSLKGTKIQLGKPVIKRLSEKSAWRW